MTQSSVPAVLPNAGSAAIMPQADAGDDQVGVAGRRVTLNGGRSGPRGRIGYRWLQVGGPPVDGWQEDGPILSFVPPVEGTYAFTLVTAAESRISTPDTATLTVLAAPPTPTAPPVLTTAAAPATASARPTLPVLPSDPLADMAKKSLQAVEAGVVSGPALAGAFESVAGRMALYNTYGEAMQEMSRRLGDILPADPTTRTRWVEQVFTPLTAGLVTSLRADGLDLSQPGAVGAPLSQAQKARLVQSYRSIASGFRSASSGLPNTE